MQKIFTLNTLSKEFYSAFPPEDYPEIEHKPSRPYVVLIIAIENNKFALPLRTNIRHDYCYKFKKSNRATNSVTGIDFTKAVIVNNPNFIGDKAEIDDKEYIELSNKYYFVIKKFKTFLNNYIRFRKQGGKDFVARKYKFTTLRYFDAELNL